MIRTLARTLNTYSNLRQTAAQSRRVSQKVGLDLIRAIDKDKEESLFPTFDQLNVTTSDRVHSFSAPCDRVIKFIKLGAINKLIGTQYCHYVAHLSRISDEKDAEFYAKRCYDLMSYLLRTGKEMTSDTRARLLCDIADTNRANCSNACEHLLNNDAMKNDFCVKDYSNILGACYKHMLWRDAQLIYNQIGSKVATFRLIDPLVQAMITAARVYKDPDTSLDKRRELKAQALEHFLTVLDGCRQNRIQFVTKYKTDFIQSLRDLDIRISVQPNIKMSGRCTSCNTHIPVYDSRSTATINAAIKEQILKGAEKGLYLNTSPNDTNRFEDFLRQIYSDKKAIDCVIDGLNIAYRNSTGFSIVKKQLGEDVQKSFKIPKPESQVQVLINAILRGNMIQQFKKILVVGKWHMTKWPGLMDFFAKHNIHFYSSYNNSKDDLFQLFAATLSPKTVLVTNDFLRDHVAQLHGDDRLLLERWIDTHQVWVCRKTLKPTWPTIYEKIPSVDREGNCFHVPVIDFNQLDNVGVFEAPPHLNNKILTWVCCKIGCGEESPLDDSSK